MSPIFSKSHSLKNTVCNTYPILFVMQIIIFIRIDKISSLKILYAGNAKIVFFSNKIFIIQFFTYFYIYIVLFFITSLFDWTEFFIKPVLFITMLCYKHFLNVIKWPAEKSESVTLINFFSYQYLIFLVCYFIILLCFIY